MNSLSRPTHLHTHQFAAIRPGRRLIVLGAVHGNETCGTRAIAQTLHELEAGAFTIECGTLTMVPITNPLAYQRHARVGDRNLNRNLRTTANPVDFEDQVANTLCPLLDAHDVLLDLHSFHTPGATLHHGGPDEQHGQLGTLRTR